MKPCYEDSTKEFTLSTLLHLKDYPLLRQGYSLSFRLFEEVSWREIERRRLVIIDTPGRIAKSSFGGLGARLCVVGGVRGRGL